MARLITLTSSRVKKICALADKGLTGAQIAARLNVPASTFYKWIRAGRKESEKGIKGLFCKLYEHVNPLFVAGTNKFSPENRRQAISKRAAGNTIPVCAKAAGVTFHSLYDWLAKGREEPYGEFRDFYEAFIQAEAAFADKQTKRLLAEGYRGITYVLEKAFPDDYGNKKNDAPSGESARLIVTSADDT